MEKFTGEVKDLAKHHGAILVGVASIDRFDPQPPYFDSAPPGHHPRNFVPDARSVISIAMPILNPVVDAPAALMDREVGLVPPDAKQGYLEELYGRTGHMPHDRILEFIGQFVGQYLLMEGYDAMFFPTTSIGPVTTASTKTWFETWEGPSAQWRERLSPLGTSPGPMSHRHVATRAGLGEFGYCNLVLTREFGPRQRFNSIVTNAELIPDPLITKPVCLRDKCKLCLKACFMSAIRMRDDPEAKDYRWVPEVDKDTIFIDTPTKTFPYLCDRRRERYPNAPVRGDCYRICPIPRLRTNLTQRLTTIVDEWKRSHRGASEQDSIEEA
jgi:epoxyqueuosine reductase QueG